MDITVTFRHMDPAESLKAYAEEKLSKLRRYFDAPVEAHVVLSVEKFRHEADVTLTVDGNRIKAVEETGDMYSALDQVIDKLEKQVLRHLSKLRDRRADGPRGEEGEEEELEPEEGGESGLDAALIEVETLEAKPMDPEEAAMQLGMSNREFLVFRNAKSMEINVLYRRKDGNLGLIQPAA